ncbi:MAG TPA: hypothetical protein PKX28_02140 [Candidatus Hydrogenedentes bacterium]|nr:PD40 domain-containing protein [Candidatus Hydrogenedentota bacterium]HOJ69877.1 hypothetical protein [Candidatus Hydrogenedentota bacterium]HOK90706.1 hypothetical protein [Candidatus Hydrogenedentota bacterium]HPO30012.1 hypothetical protein [Candidatus Hydrogenedentota bacterium]
MIGGVLTATALVCSLALPDTGAIAFISGEEQNKRNIHVYDFATRQSRGIGTGTHNGPPSWSPDGSRVAFTARVNDRYGVAVVNLDGTDPKVMPLDQDTVDDPPRWSPDGTRLACSTIQDETPPRFDVAVWNLETSEVIRWGGDTRPSLRAPVWMPSTDLLMAIDVETQRDEMAQTLFTLRDEAEKNGVLIALAWFPDKTLTEPVLVTPSTTLPLLYLAKAPSDRSAEWNLRPDRKGRQIAFESDMGGDREIYVLGKRGIVNVTNHPAADWNPRWSPDGRYLAFESFRDGRRGIYLTLVETARVTPVAVSESGDCWSPEWSPDGKWLAFVSDLEGRPAIHVCQPDGSDRETIAMDTWALAPAWRPEGK